ncbi:MAG: hypothetical protein ACLRXC_11010 [[Clostridium] leptum]
MPKQEQDGDKQHTQQESLKLYFSVTLLVQPLSMPSTMLSRYIRGTMAPLCEEEPCLGIIKKEVAQRFRKHNEQRGDNKRKQQCQAHGKTRHALNGFCWPLAARSASSGINSEHSGVIKEAGKEDGLTILHNSILGQRTGGSPHTALGRGHKQVLRIVQGAAHKIPA